MKIPAVSAIEYCLSQLQKQKQLYFYENGFHRSPRQKSKKNKSGCPEMVSVAPLATSTMTTSSPANHQLSSVMPAVNTPVKTKPKPNANTSKQKNKKPSKFSAGLKKLRQSIRLSTGSKNNAKNKREIQKQNSDSGVDTCKGSVNPSLASNSFVVMTPNESAVVQVTGQSEDVSLEVTPSPPKEKKNHIRIDRNQTSQGHLKIPQLINYQSDMESVASSRYTARIKTKPKVRNGRRRSSKKSKMNSSLNTSQMNSTSMTHRNDSSRESSSRPSSGMKSSMVSGTRPVSPDDVVHDHNTSALTQGTDVILDYGYSRGESTMLLDHEVDQINRRNCDFGETSSITINAPDDMEDDLKFTPSIKSQTLPRQSRLFAPMSDPVPRSSSRLSHNKSPFDSKMLQTSKPMYLRKSKSTTPGNRDFSNVISQLEKTLDRLDNQSGQNRPRSRSETRSIPVDQLTNNNSFGDTYHQLNRTIREQPVLLSGDKPVTATRGIEKIRSRRQIKSSSNIRLENSFDERHRSKTPAPRLSHQHAYRTMQSTPRSVSVLPLEKYKIQQRDAYAASSSSAVAACSTRHQPNEYPFELLEKLQLTRDEWVQYFKDRTLTPSATLQLQELLQQRRPHELQTNV